MRIARAAWVAAAVFAGACGGSSPPARVAETTPSAAPSPPRPPSTTSAPTSAPPAPTTPTPTTSASTTPAPTASATTSSEPDSTPPPTARSPHVTVSESGGIGGMHESVTLDADGTVTWENACNGRGAPPGKISPAAVRALMAELRRSHVFDPDTRTTGSAGCSDDIYEEVAIADAAGEDSASAGRCDDSAYGDRVRAAVERVYAIAGRPVCRR